MRAYWTYPLSMQSEQTLWIPDGAAFMTIQINKHGPELWVKVNPEAEEVPYVVEIHDSTYGGHDADSKTFIDSFEIGKFTFLVYVRERNV